MLSFTLLSAQNWEISLLTDINPNQTHPEFQKNITNSVYPLALATPLSLFTVGLVKKDKKLKNQGLKIGGAIIINTAISQALKYTVNRPRPYEEYPNLIIPYTIEKDASFPSGHTSTAFALATSISLENKKWYVVVPSYLWATSVGYSRLHLGQHYLTDVLFGATLGVGSAYLSNYLFNKINNKKQKKSLPIQ